MNYKHLIENEFKKNNKYKVAMYVRLSREDEDKNSIYDASESIVNQKSFITAFANEHGFNIVETYCDDGISGTTFDRPDFNRMIHDIETKKINMVITKDLSRFGRDYSKTGYYIENYFPSRNIRFIAINDGYDSNLESSNNDMVPFKTVFNDMYARDISTKVKTALRTKQKNGEYIGTSAPFGYMKNPDRKGHLIPDPVSSKYVKKMFELYLSGYNLLRIANYLTEHKIPTPSEYSKVKNTQKYIKGLWNEKSVKFILSNEVYIGHTIQHKKKKVNYKVHKQIDIPKTEWIKVENTHQPIISKSDFEAVAQILKKRYFHKEPKVIHLLSGFLFCGHCGAPVTYVSQYAKGKYYTCCSTAKRTRKELNLCQTSLIHEDILNKYVLDSLRDICYKYLNIDKLATDCKNNNTNIVMANLLKDEQRVKEQLEENKAISFNLYKDKVSGAITLEQYNSFTDNLELENKRYQERLSNIQADLQKFNLQIEDTTRIKKIIQSFLSFENPDRDILALLIDKVVIDLDKTITIYYNFTNPEVKKLT